MPVMLAGGELRHHASKEGVQINLAGENLINKPAIFYKSQGAFVA